ncbi:MAG: methyltransferase domain-containing protein [Solirubrobacterales bacterium]|nr:methyltransferase domain-containing protein [Solirubrobacterales bacterium]
MSTSTPPLSGPQTIQYRPRVANRDLRWELASELLHGEGLEIGALHLPLRVPDTVKVRYVDRMSVPDLRHHYAELAALDLTPVDVIDNGETLETVPENSVDFIIANHFLEHCQDPIQTIGTHLGKLRPGGVLFYAVPDKRYTFDYQRDVTPLAHVIEDHEQGAEKSRSQHYWEWVRWVDSGDADPADDAELEQKAAELEAADYSIHFHVWTQQELLELFLHLRARFTNFDLEAFRPNEIENIVVLRKHGQLGAPDPQVAGAFVKSLNSAPADVAAVPEGFDPVGYLVNNPDVFHAQVDPFTHYVQYGQRENRTW